jgi:hypothetical protein
MMRRILPSSEDGVRLARLAEEIARMVNPQCWFDLRETDKTQASYWNELDLLLSAQSALICKQHTGEGIG